MTATERMAIRASSPELIAIAEARALNPIAGECYFVQRWDSDKQRKVWAVQASIAAALKTAKPRVNAGQLKELQARATRRRELQAEIAEAAQAAKAVEQAHEDREPGEEG